MLRASLVVPIAIMLLSSPLHAQVLQTPQPGKISLRAFLGYGQLAMDDYNSTIVEDEQYLTSFGLNASFDEVGGAVDYGAGLFWQVSKTLSFGAETSMLNSGLDNKYSDYSGGLSFTTDFKLLEFMGVAQYWFPGAPGLSLGASGGYGKGQVDYEARINIFEDPSQNTSYVTEFTGGALIGNAFVSYTRFVSDTVFLAGNGGMRFRNLGELENDNGDPLFDNSGGPVEFDFSGFYFRVCIGFQL